MKRQTSRNPDWKNLKNSIFWHGSFWPRRERKLLYTFEQPRPWKQAQKPWKMVFGEPNWVVFAILSPRTPLSIHRICKGVFLPEWTMPNGRISWGTHKESMYGPRVSAFYWKKVSVTKYSPSAWDRVSPGFRRINRGFPHWALPWAWSKGLCSHRSEILRPRSETCPELVEEWLFPTIRRNSREPTDLNDLGNCTPCITRR